ncbi:sulfotransferase [filamentous cyanobacterium CCP3]|nr:sulfotransferase [filamentous cyanobacterium CCP3]
MKLPNFLVIGAGKAGTTSLYFYLAQHPEVFMSPLKEVNFFAVEGQRPTFRGLRDDREAQYCFSVNSLEEYSRLFSEATKQKAIGEISPYYLYSDQAAQNIKKYLPKVKLIAILRNPVDRAYSNFLHLRRDGREPLTSFADALKAEETRIKNYWSPSWHYQKSGFYFDLLSRYYERFNKDQIKVCLYEDYVKQPIKTTQEILDFIGVDASFIPDISGKYNVSGMPRNRLIHDFISRKSVAKTVFKPLLPKFAVKGLISIRDSNLEKPNPLDADLRKKLVELYLDDITKLQDLIQRDLSDWMKT